MGFNLAFKGLNTIPVVSG